MHHSDPTSPLRHRPRALSTSALPRSRTIVLISVILFVALGAWDPAAAYKLILKDGTQLDTVEPYRVEGDRAVFTLTSGTQSAIALSEVDIEKTRQSNQRDLGTAVVIDRDGTAKAWDPESMKNQQSLTLQRLLRERMQKREAATSEPEETSDLPTALRKTVGGHEDLLSLERTDPLSLALAEKLDNELRKQGASGFLIYQGTRTDRLFIEWPSKGEHDILDRLPRLANALQPTLNETALGAVELLFVTGNRERAGQFLLDSENSVLLANKAITAGEFFVAFVEF